MKPAMQQRIARRAASRGVTLVELLISVTIGLALVIVIAQLFLGSRQTFATTDDVSRMQENIRYAQQLLIRTVHQAGFKSRPNSVTNTVFPDPPSIGAALDGTEGGGNVSDTLTVRYHGAGDGTGTPDGTTLDCLGNRRDGGVLVSNTFAVRPTARLDSSGVPINGLHCSVDDGLTWVEIVPDVVNMQVVYGQDSDAVPDLTINRYVVRTSIPDNLMANVMTVRIALLFQTPNDNVKTLPDAAATYDLNGVNGASLTNFADRRIRRVVTTTINLRNRTP
jgi:type IV pilus assembly protein PilW